MNAPPLAFLPIGMSDRPSSLPPSRSPPPPPHGFNEDLTPKQAPPRARHNPSTPALSDIDYTTSSQPNRPSVSIIEIEICRR
ncbi:hypothetical protein M422DRAFT_266475 [Sphaerobolus stellatus SS14]|uniref:Uncharacterized protein n=1 Tax=Sphaerobolus stellatus (strain SS14) TaxID=990650 RepID=A0A0C9URM2_SPHS4|nr:hypothetical protein M422DRAFT_266475 [Sphaerobolus stellatus SS14]